MFDLETLGLAPGAPIISIGAVAFDETKVLTDRTFYRNVSLASCAKFGLGGIDASTVEWWFHQSDAARAALFDPAPIELDVALREFVDFAVSVTGHSKVKLWANGSHFDYGILLAACDAASVTPAWDHAAPRDLRTLRDLAARFGIGNARSVPAAVHHALSDAIAQATEAVEIIIELRRRVHQRYDFRAVIARLQSTVNHRDAAVATDSAYLYGELVFALNALRELA